MARPAYACLTGKQYPRGVRRAKPAAWLGFRIGARLAWGLATGLGLASLGVAVWGLGGVAVLGVWGVGLALLGYWLEGMAYNFKPTAARLTGCSAAVREPRVRVTIQPPPAPFEGGAMPLLTELGPAPPPQPRVPDPKVLRRYRRLRQSGMQPLFELETLGESA
jgi:hypothetical protein